MGAAKNKRLTAAQRYMLDELRADGPLDHTAMSVRFGRQWKRIWGRLRSAGLAVFRPYARDARHYYPAGGGLVMTATYADTSRRREGS